MDSSQIQSLFQYGRSVLSAIFLLTTAGVSMAEDDLFSELDAAMGETPKKSFSGSGDLFDELDMGFEDGDEYLFGGHGESSADAQPEGIADLITKLLTNFSGKARERYNHFWVKPRGRPNIDKNSDVINVKLYFETWTGQDSWRFDFSGWGEGGNAVDRYSGVSHWLQDRERYSRHFEANELYLTLSQDDFDVTLGKKVFNNGLSTLFSPADRMKPLDINDPMDQRILGIWQAVMDYYWNGDTWTVAVFPVYQTIKNPGSSSRWLGSDDGSVGWDFQFSDNEDLEDLEDPGVTVSDSYPDIEFENFSYFLRTKTAWEGYDLFLSAYYGLNPYWVLAKNGDNYTKEIVKVGNFAVGSSTTWKAWEIHGEALYSHSFDGKDDGYLNYVVGTTYTFDDFAKKIWLEQINVTLEYAGEWVSQYQSAEGYIQSSRHTRVGRSDIFTRINFKYNEDLSFIYMNNIEFLYDGNYNKLEVQYRIMDGLKSKIALEFFNSSSEEGYYGRFRRNDRGIFELEYSF